MKHPYLNQTLATYYDRFTPQQLKVLHKVYNDNFSGRTPVPFNLFPFIKIVRLTPILPPVTALMRVWRQTDGYYHVFGVPLFKYEFEAYKKALTIFDAITKEETNA